MTQAPHDTRSGVENTDESMFNKRAKKDCPEYEPDSEFIAGTHPATFTLSETDDVAVRALCAKCGIELGEWDSTTKAVDATPVHEIGECPGCNEAAWFTRASGITVRGEVWHKVCWHREKHGFEEIEGDAPIAPSANRPVDVHRRSVTEIGGETFEWDEYKYLGKDEEYIFDNLPTRDQLRPDQLEQLRTWVVTENPTGGEQGQNSSYREFPALFVLAGGHMHNTFTHWVCPDCGSIVEPKRGDGIVLEATCSNCGSDEWLTRGDPLLHVDEEDLEPLSDRERQVVHLYIIGFTHEEIADTLNTDISTVRTYLDEAKTKAQEDNELRNALRKGDVLGNTAD